MNCTSLCTPTQERQGLLEWKLKVGVKGYCKGRFSQEVEGPEILGF